MTALSLGYSPCPNDTFIFYALVHQKIPLPGLSLKENPEDVETLNQMALQCRMDITKISYHAFGYLRNQYALLRSGGALGKGCGPLLVTRVDQTKIDPVHQRIAVPGELTTAYLLLRLHEPKVNNIIVMPFHKILQAVQQRAVEAGLIIHESRFTYQRFGLKKILDLGDWWEQFSGYPIPLGGIIVKRTLGKKIASLVEEGIRQSIYYARKHPEETRMYIHKHAQEIENSVTQKHINLYVNEYSLDIGPQGEKAIRFLLTEAERKGLIPHSSNDIFI